MNKLLLTACTLMLTAPAVAETMPAPTPKQMPSQAQEQTETKTPVQIQAQASAADADINPDVQKYMELSDIKEKIEAVPEQLASMKPMMVDPTASPQEQIQKAEAIDNIIENWDSEKLVKVAAKAIEEKASDKDIKKLIEWEKGPLASKFEKLEAQAENPNIEQKAAEFATSPEALIMNPEKKEAIQEVIETAGAVDEAVTTLATIEKTLESGDPKAAKSLASQDLEPVVSTQVATISNYVYRHATIDDLKDYVKHFASPLGKKEVELSKVALETALAAWADENAGGKAGK